MSARLNFCRKAILHTCVTNKTSSKKFGSEFTLLFLEMHTAYPTSAKQIFTATEHVWCLTLCDGRTYGRDAMFGNPLFDGLLLLGIQQQRRYTRGNEHHPKLWELLNVWCLGQNNSNRKIPQR